MTDQTTTPPEPPIGSRVVHPVLGVYRRFEDGHWRVEDDTMTWFGLTPDGDVETLDPAEESAPAPVVPDPSFASHVGYLDIEAMTRARMAGLDALAVREVPAGEAREGDMVTRRGTVGHVYPGGLTVDWGPGVWENVDFDAPGLTFSRPVSPLPSRPGAVIRCEIKGHSAPRVAEQTDQVGVWQVVGFDRLFGNSQITRVIQVLDVGRPAGAGVSEGGKA